MSDDLILPRRPTLIDLSKPKVYRQTPEELMLRAARMRRDGMSREAIMKELEVSLSLGVTHQIMDNFLDRSEALLNDYIARGIEPAESRVSVMLPDPAEDADDPEAEVSIRKGTQAEWGKLVQ